MTLSAVFAATDLSAIRLINETGGASWSPAPAEGTPNGEAGPNAALDAARRTVSQAAEWVAAGAGGGRRLSLVCVDTSDSQCQWLRSPSREEPAVVAAARAAGEDWGASLPIGSLQGLWDPPSQGEHAATDAEAQSPPAQRQSLLAALTARRGAKGVGAAAQGVVISIPDALIRLWLDELDERSVRADRAVTLWHAMAAAWAPEAPPSDDKDITAIILLDNDRRAVWAWSAGSQLVVGGQVSLARSQAPREGEQRAPEPGPAQAAPRLSMDWLSWGAHLGTTPARIVIVGPRAQDLARSLAERWPAAASASCIPSTDPIAETVRRAATALRDRPIDAQPRHLLVGLTHRPTRALRARYRWGAVALVLLALALAATAWRMQQAATAMRAMAESTRADIRARIESLNDPTLAAARSPVLTLESKLAELRNREAVKLPESPKPIYAEITRTLDVLTEYPAARLTQLNVDSRQQSQLQLIGLDRRTTEELAVKLEQLGGSLVWSRTSRGGGDANQQVVFNGAWIRGE